MADGLAKAAHQFNAGTWKLNVHQHNDMICHAQFREQTTDTDLRQVLKLQSIVRHHYQWLGQNRTREYIPDWTEVLWIPTLRIIHNNNPPKRMFTSKQDCQLRAHRIKKMHGMLPTLQHMKQRHPDLYDTTVCRRCETEEETEQHLWKCSVTMEEQQQEWEAAVGMVNAWGRRAWRHSLRKWKEGKERASKAGKEYNSKQPEFRDAREEEIWNSLGWLKEIQGRKDGGFDREVLDDEPTSKWSVMDLYRSLVPERLLDSWKELFGTTTFVATYMTTQFVAKLEEFGRAKIWNKRCEDTIAWEKSIGIAAMSKRARRRTGVEESFRSGGDFSDLSQRRQSTQIVAETKKNADQRVLRHFMGRLKLGIMERAQGLQTNLLTLDLD